jgi:hypothetical protein
MLKALTVSGALVIGIVAGATAQSLTPEQLQAMIDQELSQENPYKAFLSDPDPERSLAAMRIMLSSGDKELVAMALEFGLLSPNPQVQRIAVEAYMATNPVLTLRIDGAKTKSRDYPGLIRDRLNGTLGPDNIGFVRLDVGQLSQDGTCYVQSDLDSCLFTINSDGIFLRVFSRSYGRHVVTARMIVNDAGMLEGVASMFNVDESLPISIQLLD